MSDESGYTLTRNPATGQVIGRFPELDAAQVRAAIQRARAAQPAWTAHPLAERRANMAALRRVILANIDELAQVISDCVGKTRLEALATEIMPSLTGGHWYERHARRSLKPHRLPMGSLLFFNKRSTVYRLPWGVVGIIA
ncbi:MAG: aldehyde dehydrogenase family protein, partial [Gammaproteobacteria bacterium]